MSDTLRKTHIDALRMATENAWDRAHALVQSHDDPMSCRIHGWLHRLEGDQGNAAYWYRRAGESMPDNSVEAERRRLFDLLDDDNLLDDE